jgi:hypothetical protein
MQIQKNVLPANVRQSWQECAEIFITIGFKRMCAATVIKVWIGHFMNICVLGNCYGVRDSSEPIYR